MSGSPPRTRFASLRPRRKRDIKPEEPPPTAPERLDLFIEYAIHRTNRTQEARAWARWAFWRKHSFEDITRSTLEVLRESADAFPSLKYVVDQMIAIWDLHTKVRLCTSEVRDLTSLAYTVLCRLEETVNLHNMQDCPQELLRDINNFGLILDDIYTELKTLSKLSYMARYARLNRSRARLESFKGRLKYTSLMFTMISMARTEIATRQVQNITSKMDITTQQIQKTTDGINGTANAMYEAISSIQGDLSLEIDRNKHLRRDLTVVVSVVGLFD